jgi:hypothetical protein
MLKILAQKYYYPEDIHALIAEIHALQKERDKLKAEIAECLEFEERLIKKNEQLAERVEMLEAIEP